MVTLDKQLESLHLNRTSLEGLPDDVLAHIFDLLDDVSLVHLRRTSKAMGQRVCTLGIPLYLTAHPVKHRTLNRASEDWSQTDLFAYNGRIEHALISQKLHAVQIGATWSSPVIPALSLTAERMVLGVGTGLIVHPFLDSTDAARTVGPAQHYPIAARGRGSGSDVVGVHELPGGSLAVAQFDGTLQRVSLLPSSRTHSTAHYVHPGGTNIHLLAGHADTLLTGCTSAIHIWKASSPWQPPSTLKLATGTRPWSALLATDSSTAFLGLTGGIQVCDLSAAGLKPTRALHGMMPEHSSPYDLVLPTPRAAVGTHTLLSAWHDGVARLHDLRSPSAAPTMELHDPWYDAGLYAAAFVGAHGICGGGAQEGIVSFWDVRMPKRGWSLYSPSGKGSPVYALKGEGGRLWGVTERRAFVLAFDGSGDVEGGLVAPAARAPPPPKGAKDVPTSWRRRGGKRGWTVHYGDHALKEICKGYKHDGGGMDLFDTKLLA